MRTNIKSFLMLILIVCFSAVLTQAQGVDVKKIAPNASEFANVSNANFTPSGNFLVVQSDVGFYIIPTEQLDGLTKNLDDSNLLWTEGWAKTFMPSGRIVVKSRRSLYTLDPQTEESDDIYTASSDDEEKGNYLNDGEMVVVSENLIISGSDYDFGGGKGAIIRFDVRRGRYTLGARIEGFRNASLSPGGKYVLYEYGDGSENYAEIYDIARNVNYSISQRFDFKRQFPKYKKTLVAPLLWVAPNRFVARVEENQFEEIKAPSNQKGTPAWLVLFDAASGKIVWKRQLKETDAPVNLQLLSETKGFFENMRGIYEISLADGKLNRLPNVEGALFVISPDKKKLAFLSENRVFVSSPGGANKKAVLDLPADWQNGAIGGGVREMKWSPDGKRLLVFDEDRLLIIRL